MFTARDGETKYRFVASRTLLNEVCGETAPEKARKAWVKTHLTDILDVRLGHRLPLSTASMLRS